MDHRIDKVQRHLLSKLAEPISVEELAKLVNLSPSRFAHLFRSEMGCTPMNYLKVLRLEKARDLLETTCASVKQIITLVGIADKDNFRRGFRKAFGMSPRDYRMLSISRNEPMVPQPIHGELQVAASTYK